MLFECIFTAIWRLLCNTNICAIIRFKVFIRSNPFWALNLGPETCFGTTFQKSAVQVLYHSAKHIVNKKELITISLVRQTDGLTSDDYFNDELFLSSISKDNRLGACLTDGSKASDCIDHRLLITKLFVFGFLPNHVPSCVWTTFINIDTIDFFNVAIFMWHRHT